MDGWRGGGGKRVDLETRVEEWMFRKEREMIVGQKKGEIWECN